MSEPLEIRVRSRLADGSPSPIPDDNLLARLRLVKEGIPWDVVCALSGSDVFNITEEIAAARRREENVIVARPLGGPNIEFKSAQSYPPKAP